MQLASTNIVSIVQKKCSTCLLVKEACTKNFIFRENKPVARCKECTKKKVDEYRKKNYYAIQQQRREKYAANPKKYTDYQRKIAYGLTGEMYDAILAAQGGGCAICGNKYDVPHPRTKGKQLLSVDHCHATKRVRGILCSSCNLGVGMFQDSEELLLKAALYLERNK